MLLQGVLKLGDVRRGYRVSLRSASPCANQRDTPGLDPPGLDNAAAEFAQHSDFMHSVLSEASLQAEIQERLLVRDALGVSFSEGETRLIDKWFGSQTAEKHALVNGVEPRLMRMAVLVALEKAVALVQDKLPPVDGHTPPTYADMLSSAKVPSFNIAPLPSGPGLPSNAEVEANFERTRA